MPGMQDILGGVASGGEGTGSARKYYGVYVGVVTNNKDPEGHGRVKVKFPWLTEDHESNWARVCSPMSGKGWGMQCIPEVEDEVLVAFEQGDIRNPYVVGSLYNGSDKPALDNSDGKNNVRQIKSRSGHHIAMNDEDGKEELTLLDSTGEGKLQFAAADKSFVLCCGGPFTIKAGSSGEIVTSGKLTIKCASLKVESDGDMEFKAGGNLKVEASAMAEIKAGANMDVKASGTMNVKGATVNLN